MKETIELELRKYGTIYSFYGELEGKEIDDDEWIPTYTPDFSKKYFLAKIVDFDFNNSFIIAIHCQGISKDSINCFVSIKGSKTDTPFEAIANVNKGWAKVKISYDGKKTKWEYI